MADTSDPARAGDEVQKFDLKEEQKLYHKVKALVTDVVNYCLNWYKTMSPLSGENFLHLSWRTSKSWANPLDPQLDLQGYNARQGYVFRYIGRKKGEYGVREITFQALLTKISQGITVKRYLTLRDMSNMIEKLWTSAMAREVVGFLEIPYAPPPASSNTPGSSTAVRIQEIPHGYQRMPPNSVMGMYPPTSTLESRYYHQSFQYPGNGAPLPLSQHHMITYASTVYSPFINQANHETGFVPTVAAQNQSQYPPFHPVPITMQPGTDASRRSTESFGHPPAVFSTSPRDLSHWGARHPQQMYGGDGLYGPSSNYPSPPFYPATQPPAGPPMEPSEISAQGGTGSGQTIISQEEQATSPYYCEVDGNAPPPDSPGSIIIRHVPDSRSLSTDPGMDW